MLNPKYLGNHPIPDAIVIGNRPYNRCLDLIFIAAFHRFKLATVAVDL